jgi:hypothetical protein
MFFWIFLAVVFVAFVVVFAWAMRGQEERVHKPGTQRLR